MNREEEMTLHDEHAETKDAPEDVALGDSTLKQEGDSISSGATYLPMESSPPPKGQSTAGSVERPQMHIIPVHIESLGQLKQMIKAGWVEIRFKENIQPVCLQRPGHKGLQRGFVPLGVKWASPDDANSAHASSAISAQCLVKNEGALSAHSKESGIASTSLLSTTPVSRDASTIAATSSNGQGLEGKPSSIGKMMANAREKMVTQDQMQVKELDGNARTIHMAAANRSQPHLQQHSPEQIECLRYLLKRFPPGPMFQALVQAAEGHQDSRDRSILSNRETCS